MQIRASFVPSSVSSPTGRIIQTWWPLAASWLLMAAELPALSAVVARLADPEINLAAYGGVVFPLALITEAVAVFLATSTAIAWAGVAWEQITGLYVGLTALTLSTATQTAWLWQRSRAARQAEVGPTLSV